MPTNLKPAETTEESFFEPTTYRDYVLKSSTKTINDLFEMEETTTNIKPAEQTKESFWKATTCRDNVIQPTTYRDDVDNSLETTNDIWGRCYKTNNIQG